MIYQFIFSTLLEFSCLIFPIIAAIFVCINANNET